MLPKTDEAINKYIELAKKYELNVTQMALAFVTGQDFVTSTLIGATNMEQLKSNIDSISLTLSEDVYKEIDSVRKEYPVLF